MINTIGHEALVYVSTELMGAKERLNAIIENVKIHSSIVAVSTIYRREVASAMKLDKDYTVELVLRIRTRLEVLKLKSELDSIQGFRTKIHLMVFDQMISMVPQLTLPWPELHKETLVIRAAAEVYPDYVHPVIQEPLVELAAKQSKLDNKVEFFMQGRSLCDF